MSHTLEMFTLSIKSRQVTWEKKKKTYFTHPHLTVFKHVKLVFPYYEKQGIDDLSSLQIIKSHKLYCC